MANFKADRLQPQKAMIGFNYVKQEWESEVSAGTGSQKCTELFAHYLCGNKGKIKSKGNEVRIA